MLLTMLSGPFYWGASLDDFVRAFLGMILSESFCGPNNSSATPAFIAQR